MVVSQEPACELLRTRRGLRLAAGMRAGGRPSGRGRLLGHTSWDTLPVLTLARVVPGCLSSAPAPISMGGLSTPSPLTTLALSEQGGPRVPSGGPGQGCGRSRLLLCPGIVMTRPSLVVWVEVGLGTTARQQGSRRVQGACEGWATPLTVGVGCRGFFVRPRTTLTTGVSK